MRMWNLNMISMLNLKLRMLIRIVAIPCLVREWLRNKVIIILLKLMIVKKIMKVKLRKMVVIISNLYGWEMCDQNFEDKTSLEKHECNFEGSLAVKRSTRRTTSCPCFTFI